MIWAGPCQAADGPSCPKNLQVAEHPATVPDGFKAFTNTNPPSEDLAATSKAALNEIMFSDGPPNEIVWLAPERDERKYQVYTSAPRRAGGPGCPAAIPTHRS